MKRHLCTTGLYYLMMFLWISSICVEHVSQAQHNRPKVERTVLDGGIQVVKVTVKTNPLDLSGRVRPTASNRWKASPTQTSSSRTASTSVKLLRIDNNPPNQRPPQLNQRGRFINRGVPVPTRSVRKLSFPTITFDFRGTEVTKNRNIHKYQPVPRGSVKKTLSIFNSQPQSTSKNNRQFPKPFDAPGQNINQLTRTGNILPTLSILKPATGQPIKPTISSTIATRNQIPTSSPKPNRAPRRLPVDFIPEFSMINQFEARGNNQVGSQITKTNPNFYRSQQTFNQNIQKSNFNRNEMIPKTNNEQQTLSPKTQLSNFINSPGNYNRWIPSVNTHRPTPSKNQQKPNIEINKSYNQQGFNQQVPMSNINNKPRNPNQWMSQFNSNQQTRNQQIPNFNNNQRVSNQANYNTWMPDVDRNRLNSNYNQQMSNANYNNNARQSTIRGQLRPTQPSDFYNYQQNFNQGRHASNINQLGLSPDNQMPRSNTNQQDLFQGPTLPNSNFNQQGDNMARQIASYLSGQNSGLQNTNQLPQFGNQHGNNRPNEQSVFNPEFQIPQAGPTRMDSRKPMFGIVNQVSMPVEQSNVGQNPISDIGQGQTNFFPGHMQINPTGPTEFGGNQGSIPSAGLAPSRTTFGQHAAPNSQGFQDPLHLPMGGRQSVFGNTSALSPMHSLFLQTQRRMMARRTFYERACNTGATIPNGREPMACNCYASTECESQLFMYISPVTRRECGTSATGYVCCCEEQRPIPVG